MTVGSDHDWYPKQRFQDSDYWQQLQNQHQQEQIQRLQRDNEAQACDTTGTRLADLVVQQIAEAIMAKGRLTDEDVERIAEAVLAKLRAEKEAGAEPAREA